MYRALIACLALAPGAFAEIPDVKTGSELYREHCAVCHDANSVTHAPSPESFRQVSPEVVLQALSPGGAMAGPGQTVTEEEKRVLALYLTGKDFGSRRSSAPKAAMCTSRHEPAPPFSGAYWNGWGVDEKNSRFQPASMAGLTAASLEHLRLKWAFAFPEAFAAKAQPAVVGGRVYVGSAIHTVYSLDAATGCIHWAFDTVANVRTGMELARATSRAPLMVYFADARANIYALDASSGKLVWTVRPESPAATGVTGTLKVHDGVVFVPLMGVDDTLAADGRFECCKVRGALLALDARTGKQIWRTDTVSEPPRQTGVNSLGVPTWGPSGANSWSSPTIDAKRKVVYMTTGDNHSQPVTRTSDAVLALDIKTGKIIWSRQFTAGDTFNVGCLVTNGANCPKQQGPDLDFGSSAILVELGDGRRLLIAGQKSGVVHALDPDNAGATVWEARASPGGLMGGIEWGIASDGKAVYVPISDIAFSPRKSGKSGFIFEPIVDRVHGGGLIAFDVATGKELWAAPPVACPSDGPGCSPAQLAAATVIPGVVFSGSMSGNMRAYSTSDGSIIWDYDTKRDYDAVGGLKGRGGTLNGPGPVIVDGVLYITAGYEGMGLSPGNVLLALSAS